MTEPSIVIRTQGWIYSVAHITNPKTGLQGKFSIEYTAAAAIADREVTMNTFTVEKLKQLEPLIKKVRRETYPENDRTSNVPCTAEITTKDGRVFEYTTSPEERFPGNPMTWDVLSDKYRSCMAYHFSTQETSKSEDLLLRLEQLEQFRDLVIALTK